MDNMKGVMHRIGHLLEGSTQMESLPQSCIISLLILDLIWICHTLSFKLIMPDGCKYIYPCRHGLCHSIRCSGTIQDPELGRHSSTTSNTITSDFTNSTLVSPPWLRLLTALKPSGYMNGAYDISLEAVAVVKTTNSII